MCDRRRHQESHRYRHSPWRRFLGGGLAGNGSPHARQTVPDGRERSWFVGGGDSHRVSGIPPGTLADVALAGPAAVAGVARVTRIDTRTDSTTDGRGYQTVALVGTTTIRDSGEIDDSSATGTVQ